MWSGKTYANVANNSKPTAEMNSKPINNLPSLIIKPRSKQNSTKTRQDINKNINPVNLNVRVQSIKETKSGSVIIKCPTKEETEMLRKQVDRKLKDKYDVEHTKLRKPRIKIPGFKQDLSEEEIKNSIIAQNQFVQDNEHLKITYINKKTSTVFAECTPDLFTKFMQNKKIFIGWERYPIYEDLSIPRCGNCQGYYHKRTDCDKKKACAYCSGEHEKQNCPKTATKCTNCEMSNTKNNTKYNINHAADNIECPTHQYFLQILRSKIDYGQSS